jgi:hypothetical protein
MEDGLISNTELKGTVLVLVTGTGQVDDDDDDDNDEW